MVRYKTQNYIFQVKQEIVKIMILLLTYKVDI